ncbi:UNVERIFIED_CONTAM: hypothetical protein K2H54_049700 [Gekko kuhli]
MSDEEGRNVLVTTAEEVPVMTEETPITTGVYVGLREALTPPPFPTRDTPSPVQRVVLPLLGEGAVRPKLERTASDALEPIGGGGAANTPTLPPLDIMLGLNCSRLKVDESSRRRPA